MSHARNANSIFHTSLPSSTLEAHSGIDRNSVQSEMEICDLSNIQSNTHSLHEVLNVQTLRLSLWHVSEVIPSVPKNTYLPRLRILTKTKKKVEDYRRSY